MMQRVNRSDGCFAAVLALVTAMCAELVREWTRYNNLPLLSLSFNLSMAAHLVFYGVCALGCIALLQRFGSRIGETLFRYRYILAVGCLVLLVALKVSGSSLGVWGEMLAGKDLADLSGLVFGRPRAIRADEWMVFTPQAFSQAYNGYGAVSSILRGTPTDMTMVYAQASWALATFFRPFLWGYLVLGSEYGLSFFWCGRLIALLMVSFEFGRLITGDRRGLSFAYALFIAFAPIVQWWFAVNGTAEVLIFSQAIVLLFSSWLRSTSLRRTVLLALGFAWCCGCLILVIYPAWQVGAAWTILAFLVGALIEHHQSSAPTDDDSAPSTKQCWGILVACMLLLVVAMGAVLYQSLDTIKAVANSAYPGQRSETGGGYLTWCLNYVATWFSPVVIADFFQPNVCEASAFFTLFPMGICLALLVLFQVRRDPFILCLLVVEAALLAYGLFGFPTWLAKITLLSHVTMNRLPYTIGFIDIVLLFRSYALLWARDKAEEISSTRRVLSVVACVAVAAVFCHVEFYVWQPSVGFRGLCILSVLFVSCAAYAFLGWQRRVSSDWKIVAIAIVLMLTGLCVNPVQLGAKELLENSLVMEIEQIKEQDPEALWAGDEDVAAQAAIVAGARTLTSVATYPNIETWRVLDPDGAYEEIYNRYAHIAMSPTNDATTFSIIAADAFMININVDDLAKLGARYWVSGYNLPEWNTDNTRFVRVGEGVPGFSIYRIDYAA